VPTETKPKKAKGSTSETTTVKKSPAKQVEKSTVAVKDPVDDWSKLSPAAIKRKTLSELAAYLESKVRIETGHNAIDVTISNPDSYFAISRDCLHSGRMGSP
jgi:hypothetical protein